MTNLDRNTDGGNAHKQLARQLADQADAEAAAKHPHLCRAYAELSLVYLELADYAPAGSHGARAWQAAEDARYSLTEGTALGASADIARVRMHLALDRLDATRD